MIDKPTIEVHIWDEVKMDFIPTKTIRSAAPEWKAPNDFIVTHVCFYPSLKQIVIWGKKSIRP